MGCCLTDIDGIIAELEICLHDAEHKAGMWSATRSFMGGVVDRSPLTEQLTLWDATIPQEDYFGSFNNKRDSYLAIAAVNALPELIKEIKRLKSKE